MKIRQRYQNLKTKIRLLREQLVEIRQIWKQLRRDGAFRVPSVLGKGQAKVLNETEYAFVANWLQIRWANHNGRMTREDMRLFTQAVVAMIEISEKLAAAPTRYPRYDAGTWFRIMTGWQLRGTPKVTDPLDRLRNVGHSQETNLFGEHSNDAGRSEERIPKNPLG